MRFDGAGRHHHRRTAATELDRHALANAPAGAGDDDDFAVEPAVTGAAEPAVERDVTTVATELTGGDPMALYRLTMYRLPM